MCSRDTVIAEHDHFITMERFMCIIVILEYTSCPEVADEHSKEWIASTVKEIITEMISSGELQISAQTPAPETNGSSLAADDLAELGGVMGMFRTKG